MFDLPPLYAIIDPLDTGKTPIALAKAYLAGGARLLQLRLKEASARELLAEAVEIRKLAHAVRARLFVNDRPDVAIAAGADGVHLGQEDIPATAARRICPTGFLIGVSTHDVDEAVAAANAGVDYVAVGPVYETTTKAQALRPRGLDLVRVVRARVRCPVVAIGGITPATAQAVHRKGAHAIAMIAALVRAPASTAAVRAVLARLND